MKRFKIADLVVDVPVAELKPELVECGRYWTLCLYPTKHCLKWLTPDPCRYVISDPCHFVRSDPCLLLGTPDPCRLIASDPCRLTQTELACEGQSRIVDVPWEVLQDPLELAALREELKVALAKVEAREEVLAQQMQPQTLEEVAQVEARLEAAAKALAARKRELGK